MSHLFFVKKIWSFSLVQKQPLEVFLKISLNSQENTCARVFFFDKVKCLGLKSQHSGWIPLVVIFEIYCMAWFKTWLWNSVAQNRVLYYFCNQEKRPGRKVGASPGTSESLGPQGLLGSLRLWGPQYLRIPWTPGIPRTSGASNSLGPQDLRTLGNYL